jgi:hypothetical protein
MKKIIVICFAVIFPVLASCQGTGGNPGETRIKKTTDFTITGNGSAKNWEQTDWIVIPLRSGPGEKLTTKAKVLYSDSGMYFLFDCPDKKITSTMNADFMDLWTEDVVEVFLWTDESSPAYFEYEISPMNFELPILISNENGDLVRWMPFHYDADRKTRHATTVRGGEKKSNAAISAWTAEFFIPYKLLRPLENIIPKSGTKWRANMYRVDYDNNTRISWTWQVVNKSYHDYQRFGTFIFE